jgi:hypothetical protein
MSKRPATRNETILVGVIAAGFGLYFTLVGAGALPVPGGSRNLHAPLWIVLCAGLTFLLGAIALLVQTIGRGDDHGELPADAPLLLRAVLYLIGVTIFSLFGAIASWIAFGPGSRAFAGSFLFFGPETNAAIGRTAFGIGAIVIWLCTIAVAVAGMRKLLRRR